MYHSITFGEKNTWDDWRLIPSSRPIVVPPTLVTSYIEVPGRSGTLDLTEFYNGSPVYGNREGSWEFVFMQAAAPWDDRYREILNFLHGKRLPIALEDDPNYLYYGRLSISDPKAGRSAMGLTIEYVIDPFKKDRTDLTKECL